MFQLATIECRETCIRTRSVAQPDTMIDVKWSYSAGLQGSREDVMNSTVVGNSGSDRPCRIFNVPGLYNSDPEHWQSTWEREFPGIQRIVQTDWNTPCCSDWIAEIDKSVTSAGITDVVLAAHSLGCATVAHWSKAFHRTIRGALLVAPSDVEAPTFPIGTTGFAPMPVERLSFPSIVVASSNDPYVSLDRARLFATAWDSEYVEIEGAGHINARSGLGTWNYGLTLIERLVKLQFS
jgi:uncharacterized protein